MAIDLKARFTVQDNGSDKLRRIAQQSEKLDRTLNKVSRSNRNLQKSNGLLGRSLTTVGNSFGRFRGGMSGLIGAAGSVISSLNPMRMAFAAVGAAAAGAYASVKVFNATVGEAMKMEQSQVMISAMFDDKKLSDSYMKMMDRVAIESPLLDSQAMYSNSKSFVAVSKDVKQLEKMWSLTERLVASDPAQGLEGAVFALRELFSGDAISMVERFEMPRDVMNSIKKMDIDDQLVALDDFMNKMGFTEKLIADMGNTALGKWTQVKERIQLIARDIGMPSVDVVSDFLSDVTTRLESSDMQKFANWGARAVQNILTGLTSSTTRIYDYFTQLTASPEFQEKSTLTGKINFVVEDIASKFQAWWDGGGREKIITFGSGVAQVLVSALSVTDEVFTLGAQMGNAVWEGVLSGIKASAKESPVGKLINGLLTVTGNNLASDAYNKARERAGGGRKSHYHGLENVPYDKYPASLHKNERVLTAKENREYTAAKEGGGGFGGGVTITGNHFTVREEADIDRIAMALAKQIEKEAAQIG